MVATTQPAAVETGLDVLRRGGTAADAAVAVAAALFVAEPRSNGLGGDMMALYWPRGADEPVALNASGRAPTLMTADAVRRAGFGSMPSTGPWAVTVPGAVAGLGALHNRFGEHPWGELLRPAAELARDGVSVGPRTSADWARSAGRLPSGSVYLSGGPPAAAASVRTPALAATLEHLAEHGAGAFYDGPIADRIAAHVAALGGPLRAADLGEHAVTWGSPIAGTYRSHTIFELGPSTQGAVAILATAVLDRHPPSDGSPEDLDRLIRSVRVAFDVAARRIGDGAPAPWPAEVERLAAEAEAAAPDMPLRFPPGTDTVFTAIADAAGNLCALSTSLYDGFGSGVEVPDTGIVLHNRAAGFSLDEDHNLVRPGRRPFHTLVPAMLRSRGVHAAFGFAGAFMQPQAQVQTLRRMLDEGYDPQASIDAPRLRLESDGSVSLEKGLAVGPALRERGYRVGVLPSHRAGTGQLVAVADAELIGGSDRRHDGRAEAVRR